MAEFIKVGSVSSLSALSQALVFGGVYDAQITLAPSEVRIETDTGNQSDIDTAFNNAQTGTVFSDADVMIKAVYGNSLSLSLQGVSFVRPSDGQTKYGLVVSFDVATSLRLRRDAATAGEIPLPEFEMTDDGRGIELTTVADINAAYTAVTDRLVYIFGAVVNGDSSKGEYKLTAEITAAAAANNRAALDAVVDTRF